MVCEQLRTLPQVARELGLPLHRLTYACQTRNIRETGRVAHVRVYDDNAIAAIKAALRRVGTTCGF